MDGSSMMVQRRQSSTSQTLERSLECSTSNQFSENRWGWCPLQPGVTQLHCPAEYGPRASSSHFFLDQIPSAIPATHPQVLALRLQDALILNPQPEYVTAILGSSHRNRRGSKMTVFQLGHEIEDRSEEHLADALVSAGVLETSHSKFVCNYCSMSFWAEREARSHVLMTHLYKLNILRRYRCRAVGCLFTSNVKSSVTRHCTEQGKPKWQCPICGKSYLRKTYKHKCKGTNTAGRATASEQVVVQPQYGGQAPSESNREQICERKAASGSYLSETYRCKHTGTNAPEPVPVIEQRETDSDRT